MVQWAVHSGSIRLGPMSCILRVVRADGGVARWEMEKCMGGVERFPCEWSRLTLSDVTHLGMSLRHISLQSASLLIRANAITQLLFESFICHETGVPVCPLVRVFRTVPVTELGEADRLYVERRVAESGEGLSEKVLQLIGTYGLHPGWCDVSLSSTHRCVPVNATTFPVQFPMLSELMHAVSAESQLVLEQTGDLVARERVDGLYMLYVPDVSNSPYILAQAEFVDRYHIRSVIGFGGQFRDGEQFCVVMFSRGIIPQSVLPLMRILSLNIRLGLERQGSSERLCENVGGGRVGDREAHAGPLVAGACDADIFDDLLGLYERTVMHQDVCLQQQLARAVQQQGLIEDHAARVQALNRQLLVAGEEERRTLSRDLHDVVATQLGGMIFQMQAVLDVPTDGREALLGWIEKYRYELLEIVQRTRELSFALHPASLERAGVVVALERLLREAGRRQGWTVESQCSESVERVLTYEESVCVYRVTQEALHNCEKHAKATRVGVAFDTCGDELILRVIDNGRGFVRSGERGAASDGGLGQLAMQERARLINAELKIESSCTSGTVVSLHIQRGGRCEGEGLTRG